MRGATGRCPGSHPVFSISIHAPHAGSDQLALDLKIVSGFQSTLPMRGATRHQWPLANPCIISIHAPHAGSDSRCIRKSPSPSGFQSTLPMRGATADLRWAPDAGNISIHAPHAGSDDTVVKMILGHANFNPRSPCGERQKQGFAFPQRRDFNPRSPCGERLSKPS